MGNGRSADSSSMRVIVQLLEMVHETRNACTWLMNELPSMRSSTVWPSDRSASGQTVVA
jgi:hypothetical protein